MRIAKGMRYVSMLLDCTVSLANARYVQDAFASQLERLKGSGEGALVTVTRFGYVQYNCQQMEDLYKDIPLALVGEIPKVREGANSSPVYSSIIKAIEEINLACKRYPVRLVDFVIVSDFMNNVSESLKPECRGQILRSAELGWKISALIPESGNLSGNRLTWRQYAEGIGIEPERIIVVSGGNTL